ncbi:hypothetical protein L0M92_14405, partial [Casaltella massiliensis]|nr:hypothetical protein [Casaltella massiliensis]
PRPPGEGNLNKTVNGKDNINLKPNSNNEQGFIGQKLKYSILVNHELQQKNNLVLKDVIPEGMKILENTIKVYIDNGYNS